MKKEKEEKQYFLVKFIFKDTMFYCIWYTNNIDGFVLKSQKLCWFYNLYDLKIYCNRNNIKITDDGNITEYNIDKLEDWIKKQESNVDCNFILNCWNIMSDISNSINKHFRGDKMSNIHKKLFYGCHIPAMNVPHFTPVWSKNELQEIYKVMKEGIYILESAL